MPIRPAFETLQALQQAMERGDSLLQWTEYPAEGLEIGHGISGLRLRHGKYAYLLALGGFLLRIVLLGWSMAYPFPSPWRWLVMAGLPVVALFGGIRLLRRHHSRLYHIWTWDREDNVLIVSRHGVVQKHIPMAGRRLVVNVFEEKAFSWRKAYVNIVLLNQFGEHEETLMDYRFRGGHGSFYQDFEQQFRALCQAQQVRILDGL